MQRQVPRFAGDTTVNVDDYDAEYVRIAKFLDGFLPKEDKVILKVNLSDDNRATYESVEVIKQLCEEGKKDWVIRRTAEKIVQYIQPKDYEREIKAIYNFVIRRLRYTKDIHKVETVHRARDLLRWHRKGADCDDFVILTGSLLQSIGHPIRIVIIGNNYKNKEDFSHIYLQVQLKDRWISLDGSVPGAKVGWEAPTYATKKIFNLDGVLAESADNTIASNIIKYIPWVLLVGAIYVFTQGGKSS